MTVSADHHTITASGGETMHAGVVDAITLDEALPDHTTLALRMVAGRVYVKLPGAMADDSSRPWIVIDQHSRNPVASGAADLVAQVQSAFTASDLNSIAAAATDFRYAGDTKLNGDLASEFDYVLPIDGLPDGADPAGLLHQLGVTSIPVRIWVDASYRTVQVSEQLSLAGVVATVEYGLSSYDMPMHISAPPLSEVAAD